MSVMATVGLHGVDLLSTERHHCLIRKKKLALYYMNEIKFLPDCLEWGWLTLHPTTVDHLKADRGNYILVSSQTGSHG